MSAYTGKVDEREIKSIFGIQIEKLIKEDKDVVYLDADLMNSFGTGGFYKKFPDRVLDMGVQEANMIGVAAGMSALGKKPYVHSFGPFASRRVFDQVFLSAGYGKNSMVVVGSDSGITASFNGGTHMPFEDVALYRVLPGSTIFDIVDASQFEAVIAIAKDLDGVVYIRTPRKGTKQVYEAGKTFTPGKAETIVEGTDATVVASGIMVAEALGASEILKKEGIAITVIDPVTVKPLDAETILKSIKSTGAVVTAENANVNGGLCDAVASLVTMNHPVPMERVGVEDEFGEVGTVDYLRERFKLTADNIAAKVREVLKRK